MLLGGGGGVEGACFITICGEFGKSGRGIVRLGVRSSAAGC